MPQPSSLPTTLPAADLSGTVIGAYRFISPLHRGGMGTIYAGVHRRLRRPVAIKVPLGDSGVHDEFLGRRLVAEARGLGRVNHPNVVTVFDLGTLPGGAPFLVMELLEGQPLSRILDDGGPLPVPQALRIAREVASGLAALHDERIINGDVKPDNVILVDGPLVGRSAEADRWIKMVDLGTARSVRSSDSVSSDVGEPLLGTSWYMSPEAVLGLSLDERSDVYSLTVMVFEMIAGTVPFPDPDDRTAMRCQLWDDPPRLSSLCPDVLRDGDLDTLVADGLAKGPDDRPCSMNEFLARLAAISDPT